MLVGFNAFILQLQRVNGLISLFDDVTASLSGAVPKRRLLALFAFPHTVTPQGTIESRKVSHYHFIVPAVNIGSSNAELAHIND